MSEQYPAEQSEVVAPERPWNKSTFDLEDVTGNPGHRNSNPNIPPATASDVAERLLAGVQSINEPPGRQFAEVPPEVPPEPLTLTSIDPATAAIGGAELEMHAYGTGFTAASIITFNGGDEPTTFVSATDIWTTVQPSTAGVLGAFPVTVKRGEEETAPKDFTFT